MNPFKRAKHGLREAQRAREKAERELEATRKETAKYRALGRALNEIVEDNHLADALTHAFRSDR